MSEPLHSPLHDKHAGLDARMAEVAGWLMPLSYRGVMDEVEQVRRAAGIFDVSHVGRIRIRGDGALDLLERLCTHDVARQEDDTAAGTLLLDERGGIIDCPTLVRLESHWLLLTSPIGREKVLGHLQEYAETFGAKVDDQTAKTCMVSLAGPAAGERLDKVLPEPVAHLPAGAARSGSFMLAGYTVIRGQLGSLWELAVILPNLFAGQAWRFITEKAGSNAIAPAGLAARDVLRIEGGQIEYGREVNQTIDPYTAGLGAAISLTHDFLGRVAIEALATKAPARRLVGLVFEPASSEAGAGASALTKALFAEALFAAAMQIPRQGEAIFDAEDAEVGAITSATFSPTLERVIAMAYVAAASATEGTKLSLSQKQSAIVTAMPFVK